MTVREFREMCKKFDTNPDQEQGAATQVAERVEDETEKLSGVERLKKRRRIVAETSVSLPVSSQTDIEIDKYLHMRDEECDDPLKWWTENKGSFVILRKLVSEILSIPASSASSEQAFSAGTWVSLHQMWRVYLIKIISGLQFPETSYQRSDHL